MKPRGIFAAIAVAVLFLSLLVVTPAPAGVVDPDPINNNQPDIALLSTTSTEPGVPVSFSPSVSDPDVGLGNMEMEIDISDLDGVGGRSVPAGDYGTFTWGAGTNVTSDVALEPLAAVNADLFGFTYTPPAGFSGLARIVFEIDDQGNTGLGGTLSRTRFINITVAAAGDANPDTNDQPDITLGGPLTTGIGTPISFSPTVSDPDVGAGDMEMEIDISDLDGVGGRSVPAGEYGTFAWGGGTGVTSDVEVQGLTAQNSDLATFTYTPPAGFAGIARIVFEIDDQGNSGSEFPPVVLSRTRFIDITVTEPGDAEPSVNNQPDVTLPGPLTTGVGSPISFAPSVSDPDVGPGDMEMEIDISDLDGVGGLSVPAGDYGTFTWGGGTGLTTDLELQGLTAQNTDLSTFTYTPPPGFEGLARIVFEIDDQGNTGSELPPNVLSRTRFIDITVAPVADVEVTKDGPADVNAGEVLTYDLTVANDGPGDALNVSLTDPLPPGTTFLSLQQTSGPAFTLTTPPVGGTGTVSATAATLADGASATFELAVTVSGSVANGTTLTNTATVTTTGDEPIENNADSVDTAVTNLADLRISKTGPASVEEGENVTYTLTVNNDGPSSAQSVVVSDPIPAGTTFVSMLQNSGPAFTLTTPPVGGTGTVTATVATMASGSVATFTLVVHAEPGSGGASLTNTATVSSAIGDPDTSDNAATLVTAVDGADLTLSKDAPAVVEAGDNISYTIALTNDGPADAQNVVISDVLPMGTTFVSAMQTSGPAAVLTTPPVGGTGSVTATFTTLADGATATFQIVVASDAGTGGADIVNTATVASATSDPNTEDNADTATTAVEAADLSVAKTGSATVVAGELITYTLTVTNDGPNDAANVVVDDELPPGTTFASLTQDSGPTFDCVTPAEHATGTVSCSIASLADGETASFTLIVEVASATAEGAEIANTAEVASDIADPDSTDNTSVAATQVETAADLVVTKTGPDQATAGQDMTYQIVVANHGPSDSHNVVVTDELPAGTTFVSLEQVDGPTFECTTPDVGAAGTVTCSIDTLALDSSATFTLVLHVDATITPGTEITNQAIGGGDTTDPDTTTNTVVSGAALVLSATNNPLPATGAQTGTLVDAAVLLLLCGAVALLLSRGRARWGPLI